MKRLFIFTFCLLLFEIGYALDVPDFMMVPKSTWVAAFPELNKADIQTEICHRPAGCQSRSSSGSPEEVVSSD